MPNELRNDPFVAAEIEAALAPYIDRLPAEQLEWMREQLAMALQDDPAARAALDGAHPRAEVDESGERIRVVDAHEESTAKERERAG